MVADHTTDAIYVLCFALLLLSVDLHNPHIKNKMSKREFVRNNRTIDTLDALDDDFLGMWSSLPPPPHPTPDPSPHHPSSLALCLHRPAI